MTHLLLRVRTIQNGPSTQIFVEVELVVEAKVLASLDRIKDEISLIIRANRRHI